MTHPSTPLRYGCLVAVAALCVACSSAPPTPPQQSMGAAATSPRTASVVLISPTGEQKGQAMLTAVPTGVEIAITVAGLPPGRHGFHIHTGTACTPGPDPQGKTIDFGGAQGHFDPGNAHQHGRPGEPATKSHAGELPNLDVDASGNGTMRYVNTQVTLAPGVTSVVGRALVVHADPDDYQSNPAGNSGARLLCGTIEPMRGVGSVMG